jgi:hypothetical protein
VLIGDLIEYSCPAVGLFISLEDCMVLSYVPHSQTQPSVTMELGELLMIFSTS